MYCNLGMDLAGCAKFLQVTERTLHNWESGRHDIPYVTYKHRPKDAELGVERAFKSLAFAEPGAIQLMRADDLS
jgi:hypothetical protein